MIRFLRRLLGRGAAAKTAAKDVEDVLFASDDDMSWFLPPSSMTDPLAWDEYWMAQIEHDVAGMTDIFVPDPEFVEFLQREALASGLCIGAGLSLEPFALSRAGFDMTVLDLSPFVIEQLESVQLTDDHVASFLHAHQFREGGRLRCVAGDLLHTDVCPGPYDFVIERRTLQGFPKSGRDAAIQSVAGRVAERGVLLSQCHDSAWKPPAPPRHAVEPWFRAHAWSHGVPEKLHGRCFVPMITTG